MPFSAGFSIPDHGLLSGLADNDHPQYLQAVDGGWVAITSGTYASATAIYTTSPDTYLSVGDWIRYKQGGAYKYGYVYGVSSTYFQVMSGDDYSVVNATITDLAFSRGGGFGFPHVFNYTPTWLAATTNPVIGSGTLVSIFSLERRKCSWAVYQFCNGVSSFGVGRYSWTMPFTAWSPSNIQYSGIARVVHGAGSARYARQAIILSGNSAINSFGNPANDGLSAYQFTPTDPVTWDSTTKLYFNIDFYIAG